MNHSFNILDIQIVPRSTTNPNSIKSRTAVINPSFVDILSCGNNRTTNTEITRIINNAKNVIRWFDLDANTPGTGIVLLTSGIFDIAQTNNRDPVNPPRIIKAT
jgi:hypothetical protein